nr:PLP-dependent aminotransferase [Phaffia rhodozyma]
MPESVLPANNANPPVLGHGIKKYFAFSPGYVNLNHGAYGAAPLPVLKYGEEITAACESKPDLFLKREYIPLLATARAQVAELMKAKSDDVVLTPNTSHAISTVLNNIAWKENDIIVHYSTTYGPVYKALAYTADRFPSLNLNVHIIPLTFPMAHAEIVSLTESAVKKLNEQGPGKVRLVLVDAIASNPGIVLPWREVAKIAKKHQALCIVDGAHLIGQQPIDLSDPETCDFFISNCHKWMYTKRALAVLWVPERNHRLIQSSFPTSIEYTSATNPGVNGPAPFHKLFNWTATNDLAPSLSVTAALDFRAWLGGEKVITDYCHNLAVEGGKIFQAIWSDGDVQMEIMESEKRELTANMVNVELPLVKAPTYADAVAQYDVMLDILFKANCFAMPFVHNNKWWVRASAQVYNEPEDFTYIAKVLKDHCDSLKQRHVDAA